MTGSEKVAVKVNLIKSMNAESCCQIQCIEEGLGVLFVLLDEV